ncbi:MAG: Mov34/MPN/PAD-1 family protein [Phycisphaerae bacterium]|nr:Mov34/MPN/PAD-1 family protein [Phycisphaerae bacterium]
MKNKNKKISPDIICHRNVISKIFNTIGTKPAETGGILLGPLNKNEISDFYFDNDGQCSKATYTPDYAKLTHLLKTEWADEGIEMKGVVHSHPNRFDRLSGGDLTYIERLLKCNPRDDFFIAPIVIPEEFRLIPWMVLRGQYNNPVIADLTII